MQTAETRTALFRRIVVGIDGTQLALQACRLANRLCAPSGQIFAVAVADTAAAVHTGMQAPAWSARLRAEAIAARDAVVEEFCDPRVRADVTLGRAAETLLEEIETHDADMVAVGAGATSRTTGFALGSVATRLIHEAPSSVLVVRGDLDPDHFPARILVGLDGSDASAEADALAQGLADLTGAELRRLAATGGKPLESAAEIEAELDSRAPVEALVAESAASDLVIVGSRGLHGFASLGSVAERVAHGAKSSVLIVRRPPGTAGSGG